MSEQKIYRKSLKLEEIGSGVPSELLARELRAVMKNIADPNTEATKTRKINLCFEIKPSKDRSKAEVRVYANSTLARVRNYEQDIHLTLDEDNTVQAYEYYQEEQQELPLEERKVISMNQGGEV